MPNFVRIVQKSFEKSGVISDDVMLIEKETFNDVLDSLIKSRQDKNFCREAIKVKAGHAGQIGTVGNLTEIKNLNFVIADVISQLNMNYVEFIMPTVEEATTNAAPANAFERMMHQAKSVVQSDYKIPFISKSVHCQEKGFTLKEALFK